MGKKKLPHQPLDNERVVVDDIVWERTNYGVATEQKMVGSYRGFTHDELAELAIVSGLTQFLDALAYELRKRGVP